MKAINKREIQAPTENGWYVCKYVTSLIIRYEDQEKKLGRYDVCGCAPILLYWDGHCWIKDPNTCIAVSDEDILEWRQLPSDFYAPGEQIKLVH